MRHTFASHLVMRGVPLKAVEKLLGRATIDQGDVQASVVESVPSRWASAHWPLAEGVSRARSFPDSHAFVELYRYRPE